MTRAELPAVDLLVNGGFEVGRPPVPWSETTLRGHDIVVRSGGGVKPKSGDWMAALGGTNGENDTLIQAVIIPAGAEGARLSFWWTAKSTGDGQDPVPFDALSVELLDGNGAPAAKLMSVSSQDAPEGWTPSGDLPLDAFIGQVVSVRFSATTNGSKPTAFFVDDVRLSFTPGAGPGQLDLAFLNPRTGCKDGGGGFFGTGGVVSVEAIAAASAPLETLRLTLDGNEIAATAEGRVSADIDAATLDPGLHTLQAEAITIDGLVKICPLPVRRFQLLQDGDFEGTPGEEYGWSASSVTGDRTLLAPLDVAAPYSGSRSAMLGGERNASDRLVQQIFVPPDATLATISFYEKIVSSGSLSNDIDRLVVSLTDVLAEGTPIPLLTLSNLNSGLVGIHDAGGWTLHRFDVDLAALGLAGRIVELSFEASTGTRGDTVFLVDAVGVAAALFSKPVVFSSCSGYLPDCAATDSECSPSEPCAHSKGSPSDPIHNLGHWTLSPNPFPYLEDIAVAPPFSESCPIQGMTINSGEAARPVVAGCTHLCGKNLQVAPAGTYNVVVRAYLKVSAATANSYQVYFRLNGLDVAHFRRKIIGSGASSQMPQGDYFEAIVRLSAPATTNDLSVWAQVLGMGSVTFSTQWLTATATANAFPAVTATNTASLTLDSTWRQLSFWGGLKNTSTCNVFVDEALGFSSASEAIVELQLRLNGASKRVYRLAVPAGSSSGTIPGFNAHGFLTAVPSAANPTCTSCIGNTVSLYGRVISGAATVSARTLNSFAIPSSYRWASARAGTAGDVEPGAIVVSSVGSGTQPTAPYLNDCPRPWTEVLHQSVPATVSGTYTWFLQASLQVESLSSTILTAELAFENVFGSGGPGQVTDSGFTQIVIPPSGGGIFHIGDIGTWGANEQNEVRLFMRILRQPCSVGDSDQLVISAREMVVQLFPGSGCFY